MKILLHMCCANCALYPVHVFRKEGHDFTGFWFNPNIHPLQEYTLRLESLKNLSDRWRIEMVYFDEYNPAEFFKMFDTGDSHVISTDDLNGLNSLSSLNYNVEKNSETFPPHPERCKSCYSLRLERTAEQAQKHGFDAFSTSLLISPYQDFEQILRTGKKLADTYNVFFYFRDFRQYFREAMSYAGQIGLYRQKYCGCVYSEKEKKEKKRKNPNAKL